MKYLCYYDKNFDEGRNFVLAATNKIDYISSAIKSEGEDVEIISASTTSSKGYFKNREEILANEVKLKLFRANKWGNVFQKILATIYFKLAIFFYLLFNVKKGEKIIVYHSLAYINQVKLAKAIKKFKLVLEVEEIYGDVTGSRKTVNKELDFFKNADAYIFPTELLNSKVNIKNKPYAIIHGTYNVEKQIANKFNDGKIHCVYAGTFDVRKGGALFAVKAAEFLSEKYHLHVLGFGNNEDVKLVKKAIEEVNSLGNCTVTYDGLKSGEEYIKFIQSCHIGLSTQNPNAKFNDTSFPSKVLSYMANGLRVVSVKIKALETSAVNELLYYYTEDNPEEIAKAIQSINVLDNYDSRAKISELDKQFKQDIKKLIEDNYYE